MSQQKKLLTEIMEADAKDGLYKQQTAVEWFLYQLYDKMHISGDRKVFDEIIIEAFTSEREQIMMAFNDGKVNSVLNKKNAEEYFKETYNK
jgi:hypothetical protein